jgi:RHS repeat-associated protein
VYYLRNQIGSAAVVVNGAGAVVKDSDYFPFGGEIPSVSAGDPSRYLFTGKERDTGSGLDFFEARFYSQAGRFMSADPLGQAWASPDPQALNRYAYARNNPLRFGDPSGLWHTCFQSSDGVEICVDAPVRGVGGGVGPTIIGAGYGEPPEVERLGNKRDMTVGPYMDRKMADARAFANQPVGFVDLRYIALLVATAFGGRYLAPLGGLTAAVLALSGAYIGVGTVSVSEGMVDTMATGLAQLPSGR